MAFNRSDDTTIANTSGVAIDPSNPVHVAYTGAAVIGAATVTASVGIVTVAAPGMVLIPAAVAGGLCAYAHYENDRRTNDKSDAKPASTTESAAA